MLMLIVALVFGLLPGFAWLVFYIGEESTEPKRLIAFTFIVGMAFGFFTVAIENHIHRMDDRKHPLQDLRSFPALSLFGLAVIEEVMKFCAAHFAINRSREFTDPVDAMIYMIVAALGFATLENIGAIAGTDAAGAPPRRARDDIPALRGRHATAYTHVGHRRLLLGARHRRGTRSWRYLRDRHRHRRHFACRLQLSYNLPMEAPPIPWYS